MVPDCFTIACVIPVFKNGIHTLFTHPQRGFSGKKLKTQNSKTQNSKLKTQMNNYRPISLLSIFNKLLEKLMYKLLNNISLSYIWCANLGKYLPYYT